MKKRQILILAIPLTVLGLAFTLKQWLASMKKEPPKKPVIADVRLVRVAEVAYQKQEVVLYGYGRVQSAASLALTSEVAGKLIRGDVPFKRSAVFRKGQVLYRIDDKEARMALHAQRADFMAAMAGVLPDIKLDFPVSMETWDAFFKKLSPTNPLPPWPEESSTALQALLAGRRITAQYYQIRSSEERLSRYQFLAPFDGTFSQISVEEGSIVNANTALGRMISISGFEVSMPVPRMSVPLVREGMRVLLYSEDSLVQWYGTVRRISAFVDAATQSVTVYVEVPKGNEAVIDGMYLKTKLQTGKTLPLMPLTRKALLPGSQVWMVTPDSLLQRQPIDIIMADEQFVYFSGLTEGIHVVAESIVGAMPNQKVNPALR